MERDENRLFVVSEMRFINQKPEFPQTFRCLEKCKLLIEPSCFGSGEKTI